MKFDAALRAATIADIRCGIVPAYMGEPGIGKSSVFEEIAKEFDSPLFVLPCNTLADKADLTAPRLVPTADGKSFSQEFYPHQVLQEAIAFAKANPNTIVPVLLDEINRSNSDITSAVLTLITLRAIGREKLPRNIALCVAGNDRGNVTTLDDASISRFSIYHVEPDVDTFLAYHDDIHPWIRTVLVRNRDYIFQKPIMSDGVMVDGDDDDAQAVATVNEMFEDGEEMNQITTPRTIAYLSSWLNAIDRDSLRQWATEPSQAKERDGRVRDTTVLMELIEGKVGRTAFAAAVNELAVDDLMTQTVAAAQTGGTVAAKPAAWDQLAALGTQQELDDALTAFSVHEKGGCIAYAVSQDDDNARIVQALCASMGQELLETQHAQTIGMLGSERRLDQSNVDAMLATGVPFAQALQSTLALFGYA